MPFDSGLTVSRAGRVGTLASRLARRGLQVVRETWHLDAVPAATPLKAAPLRERGRRIRWLRHLVQAGAALLVLWIGYDFVRWVRGLEAGIAAAARPPGVEGFLPIAALMSLRHLWSAGEVHPVHPAGLVILLAILGTGFLLKKAFCSWLCPVGTLSEMLGSIGIAAFGRRLTPPRVLDVPLRGLKYLLLLFFLHAIFVVMGSHDVAAFLDSPYNRVADIKMLYFFERLTPFALKVLLVLAFLSMVVPHAWCRYLCPYGALLGALSLVSPLKVTRHVPSCIDCGLCTKACPSRLPVERLRRVRSDECFGCLSCVAACPVPRALRVEAPSPWRLAARPAVFAALVVVLFAGTRQAARAWGVWRNAITDREYAERLREIDSYDHFRGGARPERVTEIPGQEGRPQAE
jgi:Fe-S-cluster-containing hydrogenase component 2